MKKLFLLMVIFTLVFIACDDEDKKITTLTIRNESSFELIDIIWNNTRFTNDETFIVDWHGYLALNETIIKLMPGESVTMDVTPGTSSVRFRSKINTINLRSELINIMENDKLTFVFINNTVVSRVDNASNGTLASFAAIPFSGQIGDKGPGGGIITFTNGSQYVEFSAALVDRFGGDRFWWNDAMLLCNNYKGGGYTDWQLPNYGQMEGLYINLLEKGLLGLFPFTYWTSTSHPTDSHQRWAFNPTTGMFTTGSTSSSLRVIAVRIF